MTDWFRSWHGAPTDPKWLGIGRKVGVAPGIVAAVAWALMDRASQASERGSIDGYDADGLSAFFGCEPEQIDAIVEAMAAKDMIRDGRFTAWERRQPKREDDSSERVRNYRERNKPEVKRGVTHGNAPDTDTDTEVSSLRSETKPRARRGDDDFRDALAARGVDGDRAETFIKLRKSKKGVHTAHSAKLFLKDAEDCGLSVADAVDTCISRNWLTVKPEYLAGRNWQRGQSPPGKPSAARRFLDKLEGEHDSPNETPEFTGTTIDGWAS